MPKRLYRATLTTEILFWEEEGHDEHTTRYMVEMYAKNEDNGYRVLVEPFGVSESLPKGWSPRDIPHGSDDDKTIGELRREADNV